jgi:hypothetical protein
LEIAVSEDYTSFTGASTKRVSETLIKEFNLNQTTNPLQESKDLILKIIFIMMMNLI